MKTIVVVDIDGTISKVGDRLKYLQRDPVNWDAFYEASFEDEPIQDVVDLVLALSDEYEIVFCTGRRSSVRKITEDWLHNVAGIHEFKLLMRGKDDVRHDTEVKPELLARNGINPGNTVCIIEDRDSMVRKWRELGFTCLQPAEGDF